jgi:tetratricopeptide (TPR) repeat protein
LNITEYTTLINKPDAINDIQSTALEKVVQEFPYFQSARALYLKGLYNQNSFKYNYSLKITAAHTTDRGVLFDFISSDNFAAIEKSLYDSKMSELLDITVKESEVVNDDAKLEQRINKLEVSILTSIKNAAVNTEDEVPVLKETVEIRIVEEAGTNNLELSKPLDFSRSEKHSFQEWLQLSKVQLIRRDDENIQAPLLESETEKQKQNNLINKFIETSPKIPPVNRDAVSANIVFEPSKSDDSYLMTETLARVYLEQKKYQKAIQAYEILILKYPEKSSLFADSILDIKNLQQNNK